MSRVKIFFNCLCRSLFLLGFFSTQALGATSSSSPAPVISNFLSVSDIHFSPYYSCDAKATVCPVVTKLKTAPASAWPSILSQYDVKQPRYNDDTNYVLLKSTLNELKKRAGQQHLQFVLVLGDFLSHDYKKNYQRYTGDTSEKGIENFVDKTMQFISSELSEVFPHTNVYMIVGNNDSYAEHYTSQAVFYKNIGPIWSPLIKDKKTRLAMQKEFMQGGYYAIDLPTQKNLRLIVLNTAYFSSRGVGMNKEAQTELNWLTKQLSLLDKTQRKALIALHIPSLANVSISHDIKLKTLGLWQPQYVEQFLELLNCHASNIMAILQSHLHRDWIQVIQFNGSKAILLTATPSISPVVGNNPGFKIYSYDPERLKIQDYFTYYYPLDQGKWQLEYAFNEAYQADTIMDGIKQLQKRADLFNEYKKFFVLERNIPALENLIYPALICNLHNPSYSDYQHCVKE